MKKIVILLFFLSLLAACTYEEKISYKPLINNIPQGGEQIDYDPDSSLTNIQRIVSKLDKKNKQVFEESLSWYGTEAEFGFQYIHGKTAYELVNILNCLKITKPNDQKKCFE